MIQAALFLTFIGVSLVSGGGSYDYKPKTFSCFVCQYKPPVTNTYEEPREEAYEVEVPVYGQDCHDEQYLAGHYVTKVQKRVHTSFRPSHDYQPHPGDDYAHGYDVQPESYEHSKPVYKTRQRCVTKVEYVSETRYRTVYVTKTEVIPAEGNAACEGDLPPHPDVAETECSDFCFFREDSHNNIARGCAAGEFEVDLSVSDLLEISENTYHFCEGEHCNGHAY